MTSHGPDLGTGKGNAFAAFIEFVHMSDPIPHVAKTEWCQGMWLYNLYIATTNNERAYQNLVDLHMYLTGVCPTGVHLTGVHLTGVYLTGVRLVESG